MSEFDPGAFLMPFGKHRGKPLSQIPADYLAWLLTDAPNLWPETRTAIAAFLRPPELPLEPPPAAAAHHDDGAPIDPPAQRRARRQSEPSTGPRCDVCGLGATPDRPLVHASCANDEVPF